VHSDHLLGSIYVEGPPNSFTERNTQVLRLLVNQISISLANALLFKEVERVSASNEAMLEMQKRALAQARAAEIKAKEAEAIAIRNMRLKEEAAKAKSLFLVRIPISRGAAKAGYRTMNILAVEGSCNLVRQAYIVVALLVTSLLARPLDLRLPLHHESSITNCIRDIH
jgi:hypothetical protein